MKRFFIACVVCVAGVCMFGGCGKREKVVAIVGSDSLKLSTIRCLIPDTVSDSIKIQQMVLRYSLAHKAAAKIAPTDSAALKLARRLTLLSGKEWSREAAAVLLNAGAGLEATISTAGVAGVLSAHDAAVRDTFRGTDAQLFSILFKISEEEAATLLTFVKGGTSGNRKDAAAMVKDLLETPAASPVQTTSSGSSAVDGMMTAERVVLENPALALKFRSQESIRNSIEKHRADLQQIYKRQLKTNESAGGVVWLVFHVDPKGRVLSVSIKSSEIANRTFLLQLQEYVRTIQFKKIPDNVGNMTFEFPFEFTSEG